MFRSGPSAPVHDESKLYVGVIGDHVKTSDVEREFSKYGRLKDVWVATNPKGFAFVKYVKVRDARKAIRALDGMFFCGSKIRVEYARPRRGEAFKKGPNDDYRSAAPPAYIPPNRSHSGLQRMRSRSFSPEPPRMLSSGPPMRRPFSPGRRPSPPPSPRRGRGGHHAPLPPMPPRNVYNDRFDEPYDSRYTGNRRGYRDSGQTRFRESNGPPRYRDQVPLPFGGGNNPYNDWPDQGSSPLPPRPLMHRSRSPIARRRLSPPQHGRDIPSPPRPPRRGRLPSYSQGKGSGQYVSRDYPNSAGDARHRETFRQDRFQDRNWDRNAVPPPPLPPPPPAQVSRGPPQKWARSPRNSWSPEQDDSSDSDSSPTRAAPPPQPPPSSRRHRKAGGHRKTASRRPASPVPVSQKPARPARPARPAQVDPPPHKNRRAKANPSWPKTPLSESQSSGSRSPTPVAWNQDKRQKKKVSRKRSSVKLTPKSNNPPKKRRAKARY